MFYFYLNIYLPKMLYQLPSGKVVYLSVEEFLDLTDEDEQYLMSLDYGDYIVNPFSGSAIQKNTKEKYYDFGYINPDDTEDNMSDKGDIDFQNDMDTQFIVANINYHLFLNELLRIEYRELKQSIIYLFIKN